MHEVMKSLVPSGPSVPIAYTIQLLIHSVSQQIFNTIKPLLRSCYALFWVFGKQGKEKNFFLIPYPFGGYSVGTDNSHKVKKVYSVCTAYLKVMLWELGIPGKAEAVAKKVRFEETLEGPEELTL